MTVTVVVPSYNRGSKIAETIDCLLANSADGLQQVEIIVVDDGSKVEAASFCQGPVQPPFAVRCIRQENAGPAAARNRGFRAGCGDLVVFLDDDILVAPDFLQRHIAAHRVKPDSVIFGPCVLKNSNNPLVRFLNELSVPLSEHGLVRVDVLASGQLSAERATLSRINGPYAEQLRTPGAEEFALMWRLQELGIEIYYASEVVALHAQQLDLRSVCLQQYKHAMGYSEVAIKYPPSKQLESVHRVLSECGPGEAGDSVAKRLKKGLRAAVSASTIRETLVCACEALGKIAPYWFIKPVYRVLIGLYFFAGIRTGLAQFERQQGIGPLSVPSEERQPSR